MNALPRRVILKAAGGAAMTGALNLPGPLPGRIDLDDAEAHLALLRGDFFAARPRAAARLDVHAISLQQAARTTAYRGRDRTRLEALAGEATAAAASARWSAADDTRAEQLARAGIELAMDAGLPDLGARIACTSALVHLTATSHGAARALRRLDTAVAWRMISPAVRPLVSTYRAWALAATARPGDDRALAVLDDAAAHASASADPKRAEAWIYGWGRLQVLRALGRPHDAEVAGLLGDLVAAAERAGDRRTRAHHLTDLAELHLADGQDAAALGLAVPAAGLLRGSDAVRLRTRLVRLHATLAGRRPGDELLVVLGRQLGLT